MTTATTTASKSVSVETPLVSDELHALKGLLSVRDLSPESARGLLDLAHRIKRDPSLIVDALKGKAVVMMFEKPSLRTRVSFEVGLAKMGAHAIFYDHSAQRIGERESVKDYAKNLERWADAIIARVFDHRVLQRFAENASVPVVNALCDIEHPCQALADMLTLEETLGSLQGKKLAFVGDGNNVCHSLMLLGAMLGVSVTAVTPKGFEPQFEIARAAAKLAEKTGAVITLSHDLKAVQGHDAVYTDCWVSMGQGAQSEFRRERFGAFQVDPDLMKLASKGLDQPSIFMHCLPAHRGEEVTDEVIDSDRSVVYDQAENRMHAQNALLLALLTNA